MDEQKQTREETLKDVKLYLANDWDLKEETVQRWPQRSPAPLQREFA